jgi:ketosteroid isomerase-like protein
MTLTVQELAMQYSRAWADRDPDAILALHTENTVFHMHDIAEPACGQAAVRDAIAAVLAQSPDLRFQPRRVRFGADHFVSEYEMSGTAEGKPFACDGVDIFTLDAGLVARKDSYVDWLTFQRQVGMNLDVAVNLDVVG